MNWQELAAGSPYQTATAIHRELMKGNIQEANKGLIELIEALSRSEKRALKNQLIRLMLHVIKWKSQPRKCSLSWSASIRNAREEIRDIQEETPSLTNEVMAAMWAKCFEIAIGSHCPKHKCACFLLDELRGKFFLGYGVEPHW